MIEERIVQQSLPSVNDERTQWTDGFFKIKKLDIDLNHLRPVCANVGHTIKQRYADVDVVDGYQARTTNLFGLYNIFMFSAEPLHQLYKEIVSFWNDIKPDNDIYYLQGWLNVYDDAKSIGWHYHWHKEYRAWHGFFGVDVDVSRTSYVLGPNDYQQSKAADYGDLLEYNEELELINVVMQDNYLLIGPSSGDMHRNIPWKIKDRPRVTIAFDIVPGRHINNDEWENHWIPIV